LTESNVAIAAALLLKQSFQLYACCNVYVVTVSRQIDARRGDLTPAERRVAAVVADDAEAVAFGTVADVARRAGTSGATVVRLAAKLGYEGFVELQADVRQELHRRLQPAAARIRRPPAADVIGRALEVELGNLAATLEAVDRAAFAAAVGLLSSGGGRAFVLSGDASQGVALIFGTELSMLRPGVAVLSGSEVAVARALADVGSADVVVVLDLARYDRFVLATAQRAAARGARLVALTDSALSPLAATAAVSFTVSAAGAGPFDSHTGMLGLANALVAAVAARRRRSAADRLDRVEAAWAEAGALVDG
jgi:DNA-binding MurR/RpiR family transcriptional regulator